MKLLEIVKGDKTSPEVIATSMSLAKKIGKVGVLVGVCHGFVGNRMLMGRQLQAYDLIHKGALPWDVDKALYNFGMPMGPFAMDDLAGVDIGWDPDKSSGSTIRERLCEMDRRGQKNGAGYYDYDPETRRPSPSKKVEELIAQYNSEKNHSQQKFTEEEILDRCLLPMVNEGAKILEEGIAIRSGDIDVVWVNGYGWPVYRGGPMCWADQVGLKTVVEKLNKLYESEKNPTFKPAKLLVDLAAEGKTFAQHS